MQIISSHSQNPPEVPSCLLTPQALQGLGASPLVFSAPASLASSLLLHLTEPIRTSGPWPVPVPLPGMPFAQ